MGWIQEFFGNVFGNFWGALGTLALKLLMGPIAFFLWGPLFKISGHIANYIMNQIKPYLGDVGLVTESLAAWFAECLRLQECVTSMLTFLIMGLMLDIMKRVF